MKILAARYDELKKARDEYDALTNELAQQRESQEDDYSEAMYEKGKEIEKKVADAIGTTTLDLEINVGPKYGTGWEIRVTANDRDHFAPNIALSWHWDVSLDKEGNLVKDSGSWSGLQIVTDEQIADLEESVRIIKILNSIDWIEMLKSPIPKYGDYVSDELSTQLRDRRRNRPDFESDLQAEELASYVGTNTAIQLISDEYYRGPVGILITGMTDKFLKGYIFPWFLTTENKSAEDVKSYVYNDERRASKNKISHKNGDLITFTFK